MAFLSRLFRRRTILFVAPIALLFLEIPAFVHADAVGSLVTIVECTTSPLQCALSAIGYTIFSMVGLFLAVAAWLFNFVISKTVFGFADLFGNSAGLIAGWTVIRDVSNIALLFGFVFIGIATILDVHGYEMKKTLPRLVIFAVLLNFSLLATEAVIDGTNVFSSILYQQSADQTGNVCGVGQNQAAGGSTASNCVNNLGIAGEIISSSKTSTLLNPGKFDVHAGLTYYMGLSIIETILMVVLVAGAILLLIRAITLVFLMVLSPIGFAGYAVPFLERYAKMWWDSLLSQSFFAPVFLILIFIGLKIGDTLVVTQGQNASQSIADVFSTGSGMDLFLVFAIMIGFLIAALIAAKQLGAYGADFAISTATKTSKLVTAPYGFIGRNTIGWGFSAASKQYDKAAGRVRQQYDAKFAPTTWYGKAAKAVGKSALGAVDETVAAGLKKPANVKFGGIASYNERVAADKAREHETEHALHKGENEDRITAAVQKYTAAATDADKKSAEKELNETAAKMNLRELEELLKDGNHNLVYAIGKAVSPELFAKLMDSKEISSHKLQELQEAHFEDLVQATKLASEDLADLSDDDKKFIKQQAKDLGEKDAEQFARANPEQFDKLIRATNNEGRSYLSEDLLDKLGKSDRLNVDQRRTTKSNTISGRVEAHIDAGDMANATKLAIEMTPKEKMRLSSTNLAKPEIIKTFSTSDLEALAAEKKMKNLGEIGDQMHKLYEERSAESDPELQRRAQKRHDYFENNRFARSIYTYAGGEDTQTRVLQSILDELKKK